MSFVHKARLWLHLGIQWGMSHLLTPHCLGCGRLAKQSALCTECTQLAVAQLQSPPIPEGLSSMHCGAVLSEPSRKLIHALKYKGYTRGAQDLVSLVPSECIKHSYPSDAILIPVPLHPLKFRERGYNQAMLLAQGWASRLGLPIQARGLTRAKYTNTQTKLDADRRKANLAHAFRADPAVVAGKSVVLVDDVLTTGATLTTCAAVLLAAGALEVHGLCVAWAGEA